MKNSIQYFTENGIPELEKIKIDFMKTPAMFDQCVNEVWNVFLEMACYVISEWLEECNTLLENSLKRRSLWQIKDRGQKTILTPIGSITYPHTRFIQKETGETVYLLDRILGWEPHIRMSDGVKAKILETAVQDSYETAGKRACCGKDQVSRETVMRKVRSIETPPKGHGKTEEKKSKVSVCRGGRRPHRLAVERKKGGYQTISGSCRQWSDCKTNLCA